MSAQGVPFQVATGSHFILPVPALGVFVIPLAAQPPPDALVDRHLAQAERLIADKDYDAALEALDNIVSLEEEHDLTLPDEFRFVHAQVALSAASIPVALDSVTRYLAMAGRSGEFHAEALKLRDDAIVQLGIAQLRLRAERGDASAQAELGHRYETGSGVTQDFGQTNLGLMYRDGRGVGRDDAEAVRWLRRASEQGDVRGQGNLGLMYANGRGVRRDDAEAVRWYRSAAEQGYARGQTNVGWMYENGRGVRRDDAEAVRWYRSAAEQGYARGQYNLGVMYENGRGVRRDRVEAARWYRMAADQGYENAEKALDRLRRTSGTR